MARSPYWQPMLEARVSNRKRVWPFRITTPYVARGPAPCVAREHPGP
jgi:hypothetical protein